jgi:hypothetical protein
MRSDPHRRAQRRGSAPERWVAVALRLLRMGPQRALTATLVALVITAGAVGPALATTLTTELVDDAGVIEHPAAAEAALDRLRSEDNVQLWAVFVDTFDGVPAQEWADDVAVDNGLGLNDALLAVAVDDRQYAYSVDESFPLDDATLQRIAVEDIEPRLQSGDWDGAVIAASDAYAEALGGQGEATSGGRGGVPTWVWLVPLGAVGVWYVVSRRRTARPGTAPTASEEPLEELQARADGLLLDTDDAITTSRNELVLARAQYGEDATGTFQDDLEAADGQLREAFRLRQQIDDGDPGAVRATLTAMIDRLEAANARLDAHVDEFDRLRDLEATAPQYVEGLDGRRRTVAARVAEAGGAIAELRARYADTTLAAVEDNPADAERLVTAAAGALNEARSALSSGESSGAVMAARAAEDAIAQAADLVAAVDRLEDDLSTIDERLRELLAETRRDIDEAAQAPPALRPQLAAAVEVARAAVASAEAELQSRRPDPAGLLRRLDAADQRLEALLVDVRDAAARAARARRQLEGVVAAARARIAGVDDYIRSRRGAIGPTARTRLAEARQRLSDATGLADEDPEAALRAAREADALAAEAARDAQRDRHGWDDARWGGSHGIDLGSLVLGGILLGGRGRGGWGHGGFGGGFGGPGSFGGVGTRGRRGGGGGSWGGGGGRRGGGGRF